MSLFQVRWIQNLIGLDGKEIPAEADLHWIWTDVPGSWRIFVALLGTALALLAVRWFYRTGEQTTNVSVRRFLTGLRMLVILLLAVLALGPSVGFTHRQTLEPVIVVARDASQSMARVDVQNAKEDAASSAAAVTSSRAEAVDRLLTDSGLLARLQERGRVRVVDFAQTVRKVADLKAQSASQKEKTTFSADSLPTIPALEPTGTATDLKAVLSEALSEHHLAGVVLLTDGQPTDQGAGTESLMALARQSASRGVPIQVVGLGNPDPPVNLQVSDLTTDERVWKGDAFELQGSLQGEGLSNHTVTVELIEQRRDEATDQLQEEQVVESREVTLPAAAGSVRLVWTRTLNEVGRYTYSMRVAEANDEAVTSDNRSLVPAEIRVVDDKTRVLLIAGTPTWDYRFLRQLFERESSIDVACWLQSLDEGRGQEGDIPITKLPRTRDELFTYDIIMLLDPDPADFDEQLAELLADFVREHSGGLLFQAGPLSTGTFLNAATLKSLRELLPVQMKSGDEQQVASLLETNDREWPLVIEERSTDHPVMRFFPERNRSREIWSQFPGLIWAFDVADVIPASTVLLRHSDVTRERDGIAAPLLVASPVGTGQVLYMGFDGTWRWRQVGRNAEYFNRFWLQTVRFLVEGRSVDGRRRGHVETDRTRYSTGDRIHVVSRLLDERYQPLTVPEVAATLTGPDQQAAPFVMRAVTEVPGQYEATVIASRTGRHTISVQPDEQNPELRIESAVTIVPPSIETARPWQNVELLQELAATSRGKLYSLATAPDLVDGIPDRKQTVVLQGTPQPLWDTPFVLLLISGLLILEWAIRKRVKLL